MQTLQTGCVQKGKLNPDKPNPMTDPTTLDPLLQLRDLLYGLGDAISTQRYRSLCAQ